MREFIDSLFRAVRCHGILWECHTDVHSAGDDILNVPRLRDASLCCCGSICMSGAYIISGELGNIIKGLN